MIGVNNQEGRGIRAGAANRGGVAPGLGILTEHRVVHVAVGLNAKHAAHRDGASDGFQGKSLGFEVSFVGGKQCD